MWIASRLLGVALFVELLAPGAALHAAEPDALGAAARALAGADEPAALDAVTRLSAQSDPRALDALLDALALAPPPSVQLRILAVLAARKDLARDGRAFELVAYATRNRNADLRRAALQALQPFDTAKASPLLVGALSDGVAEVRATAAQALATRKDRAAVPKLIRLLELKDAAAPSALAALGTPELAHKLSEMLGQVPDALLCATLGEMVKRPDFGPEPIRGEIVHALAQLPGIDSTSALIEYVAATEKDPQRPSRLAAQKIVDQRSSQ